MLKLISTVPAKESTRRLGPHYSQKRFGHVVSNLSNCVVQLGDIHVREVMLIDRGVSAAHLERKLLAYQSKLEKDTSLEIELRKGYVPLLAGDSVEDNEAYDLLTRVFLFFSGQQAGAEGFQPTDKKVLLVLGESGSGKSLFSKLLYHQLWEGYGAGAPIPVFVPLAQMKEQSHALIESVLRDEMGFGPDEIEILKTTRRFLLIADGYDERGGYDNLYKKSSLGDWDMRMLVTCRREHVSKKRRYQSSFMPFIGKKPQVSGFDEVLVRPFDDGQINTYLEGYVKATDAEWSDWRLYRKAIDDIPSLAALIESPLILSMIVDVLPDIMAEMKSGVDLASLQLTQSKLYKTFLDQWFTREEARLEEASEMPDEIEDIQEEYWNFCIQFAQRLAIKGNSVATYVPPSRFAYASGHDEWGDLLGKDPVNDVVRQGCPIKTVGPNQTAFIHKSIGEFFVAYAMVPANSSSIGSQDSDLMAFIRDHRLNERLYVNDHKIIQFFVELMKERDGVEALLFRIVRLSTKRKDIDIASANSLTFLNAAGVNLSGQNFRNVRVPGADLSNCVAEGADFSGANLTGVMAPEANFGGAKFVEAVMADVDFGSLPRLELSESLRKISISPNGAYLAGKVESGRVLVWDLKTYQTIFVFEGPESKYSPYVMTFSPDNALLLIAGEDQVLVFDLESGESFFEKRIEGYKKRIGSGPKIQEAGFSMNGNLIFYRVGESYREREAFVGTILVSMNGSKHERPLTLFTDDPYHIEPIGDSQFLMKSDGRDWIVDVERETKTEIDFDNSVHKALEEKDKSRKYRHKRVHDKDTRCLDISNGRILEVYERCIIVYDLESGKPIRTIETNYVLSDSVLNQAGTKLYSFHNRSLSVLDLTTGKRTYTKHFESKIKTITPIRDDLVCVQSGLSLFFVSPSDRVDYGASRNLPQISTLRLSNNGQLQAHVNKYISNVNSYESPTPIAVDQRTGVMQMTTGSPIAPMPSISGHNLLGASRDSAVVYLDDGSLVNVSDSSTIIKTKQIYRKTFSFSDDGSLFFDGKDYIFNLSTKKSTRFKGWFDIEPDRTVFSPDNQYLAFVYGERDSSPYSSKERYVCIVNTQSGERLGSMPSGSDEEELYWSDDGRLLFGQSATMVIGLDGTRVTARSFKTNQVEYDAKSGKVIVNEQRRRSDHWIDVISIYDDKRMDRLSSFEFSKDETAYLDPTQSYLFVGKSANITILSFPDRRLLATVSCSAQSFYPQVFNPDIDLFFATDSCGDMSAYSLSGLDEGEQPALIWTTRSTIYFEGADISRTQKLTALNRALIVQEGGVDKGRFAERELEDHLRELIRSKDKGEIQSILKEVNLFDLSFSRPSLLTEAIECQDPAILELLLKSGVDARGVMDSELPRERVKRYPELESVFQRLQAMFFNRFKAALRAKQFDQMFSWYRCIDTVNLDTNKALLLAFIETAPTSEENSTFLDAMIGRDVKGDETLKEVSRSIYFHKKAPFMKVLVDRGLKTDGLNLLQTAMDDAQWDFVRELLRGGAVSGRFSYNPPEIHFAGPASHSAVEHARRYWIAVDDDRHEDSVESENRTRAAHIEWLERHSKYDESKAFKAEGYSAISYLIAEEKWDLLALALANMKKIPLSSQDKFYAIKMGASDHLRGEITTINVDGLESILKTNRPSLLALLSQSDFRIESADEKGITHAFQLAFDNQCPELIQKLLEQGYTFQYHISYSCHHITESEIARLREKRDAALSFVHTCSRSLITIIEPIVLSVFSEAETSMIATLEAETNIEELVMCTDPTRMKFLVTRFNVNTPVFGYLALVKNVRKGNVEICKILLEAGANPDKEDDYGKTARKLAASHGKSEIRALF